MADYKFNTPEGQTVARHLMIACLNTGTSSEPVWSPFGMRVESSEMEFDWNKNSIRDILGHIWTSMDKPIITQGFDAMPIDAGDPAAVKLWNVAIKDQDAQALANQDMMIAHYYTDDAGSTVGHFAERYSGCAIEVTSFGGDGGGNLKFSTEVTYGGTRTLGAAVQSDNGKHTFAPEGASA